MKQCLIVCLLIVGFSTLGLFFWPHPFWRSANLAGASVPGQSPTSSAMASAVAARPVAMVPQPAPVQTNPTSVGVPPARSMDAVAATAALENFAKWAEQFSRSSANVVEGQRLAWKRREAMLELIQTDPAKALALAAPFSWRQQLPAQVTRFLEQQLDGRGDFNVAMGTDFAQGKTVVFRNVQLGGSNYLAFVYGRRLTQSCRRGIPLHGIALDGKMAVSSEPLRVLAREEAVARAQQRGQPLDEI